MKTASHSSVRLIEKAILPKGFRAAGVAAGLKASGAPDMAMILSDTAAAVAANTVLIVLILIIFFFPFSNLEILRRSRRIQEPRRCR
mgnify:CR=1 FL=1